jgi:hypothetical protein
MYPRKPLTFSDQLVRLKTYLRRARTDLRRKYDELFEATKRRWDCPLEVSVRRHAVDHVQETVNLLEACVEEMQRQEAMVYAPFKPGERIVVRRDCGESYGPYLVVDVLPDKKTRYAYECVQLTKNGSMYKKGGNTRVWPSISVTIGASDCPLSDEGAWASEYLRRCAETSSVLATQVGDLRLFEIQKMPLGGIRYTRKDRLDPPSTVERGL